MNEVRLIDVDILLEDVSELEKITEDLANQSKVEIIAYISLKSKHHEIKDMRRLIEKQPIITLDNIKKDHNLVSIDALKQIMWERDMVVERLKEIGYGFDESVSLEEIINNVARGD